MLTVPTARGDAVVPKNPERVAVYDWAALDTLTELGVDVGATTAPVRVDYLQPAFDKAATVGTLFEPDYEALHRYNPQLVITGGPGAEAYEQLAKNATTIDLTVDNGNIRTSGEKQMETLARIFGKEARAAELKAQIDALFAQTREAAKGKGRGLVLSVTGNKVSAFGTQSRLASWIHGDIGLPPVDESLRNEGHGQPVSFEYIKEKKPTGFSSSTAPPPSGRKGRRPSKCWITRWYAARTLGSASKSSSCLPRTISLRAARGS